MVLREKRGQFLIGNGAEIRPLKKGRKTPDNKTSVSHNFAQHIPKTVSSKSTLSSPALFTAKHW